MATTYQWVRHLGTPSPYTGITGAIGSPFAAYISDLHFGVRTVINPLPTTFNVDYTWRSQVYRDTLRLFDIEWRYRRDSSLGPRLHGRNYNDSGVPGGWVDMTSVLAGMPSGMLILDSTFNTSNLGSIDAEVVETYLAGTTQVQYDYREDGILINGGIGTSTGVLGIGAFDIRTLAIRNLRADKFITDLSSEENTINFKADIYALPGTTSLFPAWTPVSDADYIIQVWDLSGSDIRHEVLGTATVSAATPLGKVAEIDLPPGDYWNGIDLDEGHIVEGMSLFLAQTAADNPDGIPTVSISRVKENALLTYQCCSCNNGCLKMSVPVESSPISYTGHNYEAAAASLGYGWSSEASSRIIDQPGELIFKSSSGGSLRWVEDSPGVYVPFSPGNYTKAEVNPGSTTARYKLTFRDQTVYEFDATAKRLQKMIDRNGLEESYSYDVNGHLETAIDSNGRSRHFTNRSDGQPLTLRINDAISGRLTQFFYYSSSHPDSPDRIEKIVDPEGNETQFFYYPNGPLWYIIDPQGKVASLFGYDNFGRILAEISYGEMRRDYIYGTTDSSLEVIEQDLVGSEPNRAQKSFFDKLGNTILVLQMVDPDAIGGPIINATEFHYEDPHNPYLLTRKIDPDLIETVLTYTAPDVSEPYTSGGNLKTIQDKAGHVTTYTYAEEFGGTVNPKHRNLVVKIEKPSVTVEGTVVTYNPTELVYDSNGNLERIIDASGKEAKVTYDIDGKVLTAENRLGHVCEFLYEGLPFNNDSRNLIEIRVPKGESTLDGFRSIFFVYDNYDNAIEVRDDIGNKIVSLYDDLDRVKEFKILDSLNTLVGGATTFEYFNTLLEKVFTPANNGTSALSRETLMVYDNANRLEEIHRDVDSLGNQQLRVSYQYTGFSQMSAFTRMKTGNPISFTYGYDRLGRSFTSSDPNSSINIIAYQPYCSGNTSTSARGVRRAITFDARCLPLTSEVGDIDPTDRFKVLEPRETRGWLFDELGRMVFSSQSRSVLYNEAVMGLDLYGSQAEGRTFVYDELDRLRKMTFPDGSEMLWDYDFEGNVTKVTDPAGKITEYTYFRDNLLKEVVLKRPPDADRKFTYSYDAVGRLEKIVYPLNSQVIVKFDDGSTTSGSGWDAKGQLLHLRYEIDGDLHRRLEFTYDDSGNRANMLEERADGTVVKWEYVYDWLDRLVTVKKAEAVNLAALPGTLPTLSTYSYDESDNRLTYGVYSSLGILERTFRYVYDDANNLTELFLTEGSNPEVLVEEFTSDVDGNMTSRKTIATNETVHYTWDDFDRLSKVRSEIGGVKTNKAKADNRYDISGIRQRKLDKNGNSSLEYTAGISTSSASPGSNFSSAPEISYLMGHQMLGAEVNGNFQYFLTDALGTVRDVIDDTGTVIQSYEFNEHGIPMPGSGAASGTFAPKTYQGALSVNDDRNDSGLYLMGHRHYAPELGRFISRDPIGFQGGLNLFGAASATNPVTFVDPEGTEPYQPGQSQITLFANSGHAWVQFETSRGIKTVDVAPGWNLTSTDGVYYSIKDPSTRSRTKLMSDKEVDRIYKEIFSKKRPFSHNQICTNFTDNFWEHYFPEDSLIGREPLATFPYFFAQTIERQNNWDRPGYSPPKDPKAHYPKGTSGFWPEMDGKPIPRTQQCWPDVR